jgi:hypothetical protein
MLTWVLEKYGKIVRIGDNEAAGLDVNRKIDFHKGWSLTERLCPTRTLAPILFIDLDPVNIHEHVGSESSWIRNKLPVPNRAELRDEDEDSEEVKEDRAERDHAPDLHIGHEAWLHFVLFQG